MTSSAFPPRDAYIGGKWVTASKRFAVIDPWDGAMIAEVVDCDDALVDEAIDAAADAFGAWRAVPAGERGRLLSAMAARMHADLDRLAAVCTAENGKPLRESAAEVRYAASFLAWFGGEAERAYGEIIPASDAGTRIHVVREPVGPCALITPWNFPYAMLTRKIGAALAAGCTAVAKPAHQTPLSALVLAKIADEVGVPAGVLNVIPAREAGRVGRKLVSSSAIKKISFTGSTEVGRGILRAAADGIKRVSLELGGNAPFVVLADADLDAAVAGALVAKFRNTGQSCVAANRFIVEAPVADAFSRKLVAAVGKLKLGRGTDEGVDVGPVIDENAVDKLQRIVADAVGRGAKLLLGAPPDPGNDRPRAIAPIVLSGITPAMAAWREEIFGPVAALTTVATEADAIAAANDTDAGLVAYLYTRDGSRQVRVAEAIEAGMVGINTGLVSTAQAPFGGVKQSGLGREGSRHGLDDYTNLKYIALRVT